MRAIGNFLVDPEQIFHDSIIYLLAIDSLRLRQLVAIASDNKHNVEYSNTFRDLRWHKICMDLILERLPR